MAQSTALVVAGQDDGQSLDPDQTLKASRALLAQLKKETQQAAESTTKKNLLDDSDDENGHTLSETPIWLVISTKRHVRSDESLKPIRIPVPHPLNQDASRTICLFSATPQRAYKNIVADASFPEHLRSRITRIIDLGKLQAKYKRYEEQRLLYGEHDIFLGDDRIISRLPKALGKTFYKSQAKRPIPVVLTPKREKENGKRVKREKNGENVNAATPTEVAAEIERAIGSVVLTLKPTDSVSIVVGYANFTPQQIAENIQAVAESVIGRRIAHGWQNVRGVYVKGPQTISLPIWQTSQLWMNESDVLADPVKAIEPTKEEKKGRKRKSTDTIPEEVPAPEKKPRKKAKVQPESNDEKLDQQISERKARLAKQKAKAKKSMDD